MSTSDDVNAFLAGAEALLDKAVAALTRGDLLITADRANTLVAAAFNAMPDRERAQCGAGAFSELNFVEEWGTGEARERLDEIADNLRGFREDREEATV